MKSFYTLSKSSFLFYLLLLLGDSSFAQITFPQPPPTTDTAITYLRDPGGRVREHNVDFISMALNVRFEPKEGRVIGDVKYVFRPIQYVVDTLFLDAPGIDIRKVLLNGKETPFSIDSDGVTIRFLQVMNWDTKYNLEISYEATPRKGLYFIGWNVDAKNPDNDRYFTRHQIWTQGQLNDNRYWIPCYDDVSDKLLVQTTVTFDSSYTVVSNGVLKERKRNADGTITWHYAMNHPMVPYLIMLGIDKYAYKDYKGKSGVLSREYYYADQPQTAEPTYLHSAEMMDWISRELQTKYPWPAYANVPVQDFMYGAMENTTATVYGDFFMNDTRRGLDRNYTGVNAHELTHQWFGDYITEYSSQNHWLHESFATYYSKQFMRQIMGEDFYEWGKRGEANAAISADKNDRYPVAHSKGGTARHYPKGSFVIDMMRYVVGDSVFRRSITHYLEKHAYSNVTNHDLMFTFMETAGVNLDWFFDQWVFRSGEPNYVVKYERQTDRLAFFVSQTQKTDELTGYFKMPLIFEVHFTDGSSTSKKVWLSHASDTVYVSALKGEVVDYTLFDPGSNVLKTVDFVKSFNELSSQALKAKHMIDRYDAVLALRDTAIERKRSLLLQVYDKESFNAIKNEIISQLAKDQTPSAIALFRRALQDNDFAVRRTVVDKIDTFPAVIVPDVEKLLNDSSYVTIEMTLRKLYKLYPSKIAGYLPQVKDIKGINDNVRIAYLELSIKETPGNSLRKNQDELVGYTSNRYEFMTRGRAMDAIGRLGYCDDNLIGNLFNAALYTNTRLSGPALKTLKALIKTPANLESAKRIYNAGHWKGWEAKIIAEALKQ